MSEFEKRDKTKGFKTTPEYVKKMDDIIEKSGKGPTQFFEDWVDSLLIEELTSEDNTDVSPELRKHFQSDVTKMQTAVSSIMSLFVSQMENISVEKNRWEDTTEKKLLVKDEAFAAQKAMFEVLTQQHTELKKELDEISNINKGLATENESLVKRSIDQEQLVHDRGEKITDLQERINHLNESLVKKDDQIAEFQPIKEELNSSKQLLADLHKKIDEMKIKHEEELIKQKEKLVFVCEKEKHSLENSMRDAFIKEKEQLRSEVREETTQSISKFYLEEIKRKEEEHKTILSELQAKNKEKGK